jgi:two-component system sensor histidine kinase PilS (NtrC family)
VSIARLPGGYSASHWRSLGYFNLYRLLLAALLATAGVWLGDESGLRPGFAEVAAAYLVCAAFFTLGVQLRWPRFPWQLSLHIFADILFVMLLMVQAEARLANTLGLLLVISIASGGLIGTGRIAMFYASLASIAVLLHHGVGILTGKYGVDGFFQVGLLCMGYFATGLLAHSLTRRALRSEQLAQEHANELALLGRIHAQAVAHSQNGLLAVRGDGRLRYASARAAELLGHAQPEPGAPLLSWAPELMHTLTDGRTQPAVLDAQAGKVRVRCLPVVPGEDAQILVLEDLSAADAAAQQMKLAALGRLTANLAHEIRNPLSAINHAAQLLREDALEPATVKLADIIVGNVTRLDRLVQEVLTLNRRDRVAPAWLDSEAVAATVGEIADSESIPANAIRLDLARAPRFRFDPDHLRRILWNLLRNAWRVASRQPGCLVIRLTETNHQVTLDLIDDGPGVDAAQQAQLFEPFSTTDAHGMGLGLYRARELAEANAASLRYVARARGAHFCLTIRKEP